MAMVTRDARMFLVLVTRDRESARGIALVECMHVSSESCIMLMNLSKVEPR